MKFLVMRDTLRNDKHIFVFVIFRYIYFFLPQCLACESGYFILRKNSAQVR